MSFAANRRIALNAKSWADRVTDETVRREISAAAAMAKRCREMARIVPSQRRKYFDDELRWSAKVAGYRASLRR